MAVSALPGLGRPLPALRSRRRSAGPSWRSAAGTAGFARPGWAVNLAGFWTRPLGCSYFAQANWRRPFPGAGSDASCPENRTSPLWWFGSRGRGRIQLWNAALPPLCGTAVCPAGRAIPAERRLRPGLFARAAGDGINPDNAAACHVNAELADWANSPFALYWRQRTVLLAPTATNRLALASTALRAEPSPMPPRRRRLMKLNRSFDSPPTIIWWPVPWPSNSII